VASEVKRRSYTSPARTQRAEATRARVLAAAHALFLDSGYRSTTTASIAREAGVSEASIFVSFGSKASLLVAVIGSAAAGSAEDIPLREQPEWQHLASQADQPAVVAEFVAIVCRAHERTWRLLGLVRAAAEGDPELAALLTRAGEGRRADCEWFLTDVLGKTPTDAATAQLVDVLWAQASVDMYRLLVIDQEWAPARYQAWLTALLCHELGT